MGTGRPLARITRALGRIAATVLAVVVLLVPPAADGNDPRSEDAAAPRIVSLAPHLTELAFDAGAGDRLVGAVEWSDHPAAARELPRIGDAFRFDAETILSLGATDAIAWEGGTPISSRRQLEALGLSVHSIETRTLDEIGEALRALGRLAGTSAAADAAAGRYRERLERLRSNPRRGAPITVFYQVSRRPLFTLGGRHVFNEVLALCGARNVFADLDVEAAAVGIESVVDAAPDVILVGADRRPAEASAAWASRTGIPAVRCGRVLEVDADTLVRPTTRLLEGAEALCERLDTLRRAEDPACGIAPR
ncbi:cobalamin-binding protein [Halomonas denitrificans]|nr:cobalamin-binding protein [Halomonas denitrificans]